MTNAEFLLTAILIQQGLLGLGWGGLVLLRLARVPSAHWGIAAFLVAGGLGLATLRLSGGNPWITYFLANSLALLAYVLARRGVQIFCRIPVTDREQVLLFALFVLVFAPAVASGVRDAVIVSWTSLFTGYFLLRMGFEGARALREEFGPTAATACMAPSIAVGALFLLRALGSLVEGDQVGQSLTAPGSFNARFALVLMGAAFVLNMGLLALVVVRAVRQLQRLSNHDALTGVLNRRGFQTVLARERDRLQRGGPGFALLSLDLDHFKRINDQHGHSRGDAALVAVAQVLQSTARRVDQVARMGGEEFIVLLPDTGRSAAFQAAGRLLDAVRAEAHAAAGLPEPMTVSIGAVIADDGSEPIDSLLHRLDETLYRAKAGGRDRVAGLGDAASPVASSALAA
jgi:diguanylate cyclase (GGDEF)-like protein